MENYDEVWESDLGIFYILNEEYHRLDGPAIEFFNGDKEWYQNGLLHRIDGPAVECANGEKYWHYKGKFIECNLQEEFERYVKLKLFW